MQFSIILLHLAGAVMLLLWAVRMVRTGVERACGPALRDALRQARGARIRSAGVGTVLAVLLQSSTAVAILAAGFAASGVVSVSAGLAILLGADLGSALVVQVLSFDLSWLVPALILVGGAMALKFEARGRILMGVAFVLLSLHMIGEATAPMRQSTLLPLVISYLRADYFTAFAAAALFTWLIHSSVAAILLFVTLAAQGVLPVEVGLFFILGANCGGALIAVWLTRGDAVEARRVPLGNLIFRGTTALAALFALQAVTFPAHLFGVTEGRQLVNLHLAFNMVLVICCLPFTGTMEKLATLLIPDRPAAKAGEAGDLMSRRTSALDRTVMRTPGLALASATRELLRVGEVVEVMLRPVMDFFDAGTADQIRQAQKLDEEVNRAHTEIKLYIAEVNRGSMSAAEAQRGIELTDFAINLERAGDIVAKNLLVLAQELRDKNLRFSRDGWSELAGLHNRVMANMQLALNVLVSSDLESARQLVVEKERMRRLERMSHDRHLKRLQSGMPQSIDTSDIHLEAVRALKEINSLMASVAYPLLTQSGDLLESRLARGAAEVRAPALA
ncbi:Na/Pi cotransporter family protein [Mesorhizobium sp. M7A.F.Ca.MR.148.00.0.0]|uniref:Na/Pi cotransporter family protein n=1 Tax=Mesorhizobium sp. M7A.F.Ca.MR.148.00.0.0 TaxID=2496775 RepID=UPI000FCA3FE9|nr:Na/Pi cotransporter family protein [Mesorhizobium sp. M7A.F.Ca.MR.148.00.0.0]RUV34185.1 Na/Pi cotransporter family protein [Mesorhizobium sp. M7A.F.Ca.MR.148.00.0.0]